VETSVLERSVVEQELRRDRSDRWIRVVEFSELPQPAGLPGKNV
jgi:hypothetical protein